MSFFKNKHVITAMIVAPILAIFSYYMVDLAVKEQPSKAVEGGAYKLIPQSNCRYSSGACDLINGTFKSTLSVIQVDGAQVLRLVSQNPLQSATVGFVTDQGNESGPFRLMPSDNSNQKWSVEISVPAEEHTAIRVAMAANGAHYFAETTMGFSNYETSFNKDFRKQN